MPQSNQQLAPPPNPDFEQVERVAQWLDDLIRIPGLGLRIGLDPILGLVPGLGDTTTAAFSIYLMVSAIRFRVPKIVILRMALNVAFDYLIGVIPFAGDAADFFIKSNRRNYNLLRTYAKEKQPPSFLDYLFVGTVIAVLLSVIVSLVTLSYFVLKYVWNNLW